MTELSIPVNVTTVTITIALLVTAAVWIYDWIENKDSGGYLGSLFGMLGCFGTCFIWMVAFGLLLLLRGCGA